MEILHLKEFGEAERVDMNAVCVFIQSLTILE